MDADRAATLLRIAVAILPAARQEWAKAMGAELDQIVGTRRRWRFSLGCAWAAAAIRTRTALGSREQGGQTLRVVVLTGIGASISLVAYGLIHYPGLRAGFGVWASVALFVLVLVVYAALTLALSGGVSPQITSARRYGLLGGIAVGASWFIALSPIEALKGWVAFPLVVALLGPALVAALAARSTRDAGTGSRAALWSGIVAGLGVFTVWVTTTYARDGGPYDAGMVLDFHNSHATDLTTYAVSDNLGSGLVLLILIPTVALALGTLTARLTAGSPACSL